MSTLFDVAIYKNRIIRTCILHVPVTHSNEQIFQQPAFDACIVYMTLLHSSYYDANINYIMMYKQ